MTNLRNTRVDVVQKVTGAALYAGDIRLPGMLHLAVVRGNVPAGRITDIDVARALAYPGVVNVFTAKDIPGVPAQPLDRPVLCPDTVRYAADGVALVAAETRRAAYEAAALVEVALDPLPALLDPETALDADAPQVHPGGNLICRYVNRRGDAISALQAAPHVMERTFTTQRVQHAALETEACVATYDAVAGTAVVYCPVNSPFAIRKVVADTLGCPLNKVRVILPAIGGSFGGKNYDIAVAASRAALAASLTGRPCRIVLDREESIREGTKRHPLRARYKAGFDDEGRLLALTADLLLDGGAYKIKSFPVAGRMALEAAGPYVVPQIHVEARCVFTNSVPSDALRGFGSPQVDFCSESLMEDIAATLGLDPLEVRRRNMLREGSTSSFGQRMEEVTLDQCLAALEQEADIAGKRRAFEQFNTQSREIKKGVGVALLFRGESFGAAGQGNDTANGAVSIQPDGSITIASSIAEVGQGGSSTMINIVQRTLGVAKDRIRISQVDTDYVPDAGPTVATRGTVFSGNAVNAAALKLKDKLAFYAQKRLGEGPLRFESGKIIGGQDPGASVAFDDVVKDVFAACDHLNAFGFYTNPPLCYDKENGVGEAYMSYVYGAAAAEVTVDLRTGEVSVDHFWAAHDVGCALDMDEVRGQIGGGVGLGMGLAVLEEVEMARGHIRNPNLDAYLIPTALDMPRVSPLVLEIPGKHGPHGAKGLGEPATSIVAPAIINAVYNATGVRHYDLPATLERVALNKALNKGAG